jgi:hypothetical protein
MCHHPNPPHVNVGRTASDLYNTYNNNAKASPFKLASTQVISKSIGITQEHVGVKKAPWERNHTTRNGYKIID